jgi:penicillin G amidase
MDRLWQLDKMRRVSQGKLSEIFGTKTLEMDKSLREIGLENWVEEVSKTIP